MDDAYFVFVDYYEKYLSFSFVLESFLDKFVADENKRLVLFVQDGLSVGKTDEKYLSNIKDIVNEINSSDDILCKVDLEHGSFDKAKEVFINCSHYIITRTFWSVYFSCMADLFDIEMISGTDSIIQFEKRKNICKSNNE